ncbi:MAG TPA: anti-sigma factor [Thermoanaerobaculia bacterium]|nr:anti-sigma factor [Thermoanaerobaculia bacterium]
MTTTLHSARHDELIPAYALGALDGDELRELEAHLADGCPECDRQLALWQGDLEDLAASVPPVQPSPETRSRILRLAGAGKKPVRPAPRLRWLALPAAALLALAVWSGGRQLRLGGEVERLRAERDHLEREVAALDRELDLTRAEAQRIATTLAILSTPGARTIRLAGLGPTSGAVGQTFLAPEQGSAVFWAFHLPAPSPGKTYQLWWIGTAGAVSAGTFDVDARGQGRVEVGRVEHPDEIQACAVTVEPAGGVPQPTGAMVLKG